MKLRQHSYLEEEEFGIDHSLDEEESSVDYDLEFFHGFVLSPNLLKPH